MIENYSEKKDMTFKLIFKIECKWTLCLHCTDEFDQQTDTIFVWLKQGIFLQHGFQPTMKVGFNNIFQTGFMLE